MRSERLLAMVFAGAVALASGCSGPDSFIVLSLRTTTATPITNVTNIQVKVSKGTTLMRMLTYPTGAGTMTINQDDTRTLSVGFSSDETGNVDFEIDALNDLGCVIGHGTTAQEIKKGNTAFAPVVSLAARMECNNVDAGAPDAPEGGTLPGCDPVNPQSVDAGAISC